MTASLHRGAPPPPFLQRLNPEGWHISRGRCILCQHGAFSGVGVFVASFVPAECPKGGDMWGVFGKPLKRAIWNTLGLHAVMTTCLRILSILDGVSAACCLFLSTGSYHVCIQIHAMFPDAPQKPLVRKRARSGCRVGAGDSASCQAGQEAANSRFTATCMQPQGTPDSLHH